MCRLFCIARVLLPFFVVYQGAAAASLKRCGKSTSGTASMTSLANSGVCGELVVDTYFPRFWEACWENFGELSPTTHHHPEPGHGACLSACTRQRGPREAALLARRRAQPARRRREVVAQLRRRSRVGFAPCDPVPSLRSSVVEAAAPKSSWSAGSSADLVTRSKRAVSRRAEPLQRARWPNRSAKTRPRGHHVCSCCYSTACPML